MLKLTAMSEDRCDVDDVVARVTTKPDRPAAVRPQEALICAHSGDEGSSGYAFYLGRNGSGAIGHAPALRLPAALEYLSDGDVIRISPRRGLINVLYRRASNANTLLLTEQCNNRCIMCCQPPRAAHDPARIPDALVAIKLMDVCTSELGISGGEPTLHFSELLEVVRSAKNYLPRTSLHVLSNARAFRRLPAARRLAALRHPDLMVGVPLNADIPSLHDYIVQAKGAFDDTIRGIMNLKRCSVRVELRIVLQQANAGRIDALAHFIKRNLAFCDHIAFMALEMHGLALANRAVVWVDPASYRSELSAAVCDLAQAGCHVSIYNVPLCLLDEPAWRYARKSISDWKVEYLPACGPCRLKNDCCGMFATSHGVISEKIQPITEAQPFR
jgi:His-Xaa-Ser system radical SAM maturase HxsC